MKEIIFGFLIGTTVTNFGWGIVFVIKKWRKDVVYAKNKKENK